QAGHAAQAQLGRQGYAPHCGALWACFLHFGVSLEKSLLARNRCGVHARWLSIGAGGMPKTDILVTG
ncbi:MAG: hypothetical protein RR720_22970, partial [Comamonas sp.]|uniref:hypothetical protein n=1 Tax=Comamonas sp. TaxID=34028 RepID=UPI002FC80D81